MKDSVSQRLIGKIRSGESFTRAEELALVIRLSIPAILAQFANVLMQYIDAAMVGNLGAVEAAAVGIVSSTIWLFWGLGSAGITGYSVLASQEIGAKSYPTARKLLRQGITVAVATGAILGAVGLMISPWLPGCLGGCRAGRHEILRDLHRRDAASLPQLRSGIDAAGKRQYPRSLVPQYLYVRGGRGL